LNISHKLRLSFGLKASPRYWRKAESQTAD
jgi:hypothetical protein